MKDITEQLEAIRRRVERADTDEGEGVAVVIRRTYRGEAEDVWDAITSPERLPRWFAPVTGDLREGGTFQVENNAGGDIQRCDPPRLLRLTWGAPNSIVEVTLTAAGSDRTDLEVRHTVPLSVAGSAAGALYVGPGWDQGLLRLAQYLSGEDLGDLTTAENSIEGQEFSRGSIAAWADAVRASTLATEDQTTAAITAATTHFAPNL
ncbi:SRPBCC family protein [Catellatospora bangladeshensis]|uniref:Activator of HSP90 ATPase n=1 Tax=Catellatospora bangladeshensis TaxID=310355 RepID=A0A8J3K081_9ACTN|nr:SRPBCC family protein [Catellatospora bangladeshensis]GIF86229.1 activator of HSP90 ATPase [Catellatospora bangladeshensis]